MDFYNVLLAKKCKFGMAHMHRLSFIDTLLGKQTSGPTYDWATDSEPYSIRKTGGELAVLGSKAIADQVVGGTVVWNQLLTNGNFAALNGWGADNAVRSVSDNILSMSPSVEDRQFFGIRGSNASETGQVAGHKYLVSIYANPSVECEMNLVIYNSGSYHPVPANTWTHVSRIFNLASTTTSYRVRLNAWKATPFDTTDVVRAKNYMIFDLTKMFGATIADYIFNLESSHAGDGVALFNKLFPLDVYHDYVEGSLQSVNASAHITRGSKGNIVGNYALDESLVLRGIPKVENGKWVYDGDVYESSGKVTRNYAIRAYQSGDETNGSTMVTDGTNTVYKLSTPVIESANPFANTQRVKKDGFEEYADAMCLAGTRDVAMPVGHITEYQVAAE